MDADTFSVKECSISFYPDAAYIKYRSIMTSILGYYLIIYEYGLPDHYFVRNWKSFSKKGL